VLKDQIGEKMRSRDQKYLHRFLSERERKWEERNGEGLRKKEKKEKMGRNN